MLLDNASNAIGHLQMQICSTITYCLVYFCKHLIHLYFPFLWQYNFLAINYRHLAPPREHSKVSVLLLNAPLEARLLFYRWPIFVKGMASRKSSSKRRMSLAPATTVSSNNIVECSEEMSDIIKRITVISEYAWEVFMTRLIVRIRRMLSVWWFSITRASPSRATWTTPPPCSTGTQSLTWWRRWHL